MPAAVDYGPTPVPRLPRAPALPVFGGEEAPTGRTNLDASRWRMIARAALELDAEGELILAIVAGALADMPPADPTPLLQQHDRMAPRQRAVLAAVAHALLASKPKSA